MPVPRMTALAAKMLVKALVAKVLVLPLVAKMTTMAVAMAAVLVSRPLGRVASHFLQFRYPRTT